MKKWFIAIPKDALVDATATASNVYTALVLQEKCFRVGNDRTTSYTERKKDDNIKI